MVDPRDQVLDQQEFERQVAPQKVALFERQFGENYRLLAYHAALPLVLTPELVHYLRTEFLLALVPSWEAEADLLLSDLCSPVGYELYAMDTAVRAYWGPATIRVKMGHLPEASDGEGIQSIAPST